MRVAWLGEPESLDATAVGGKTANLGRLAASFRVPPGFCLDAAVFDELHDALDGDPTARGRLLEMIEVSYRELARRVGEPTPRVAVRSSAIGEDAKGASFAGQHETVLDLSGPEAILDAVLDCWRSVDSERAAAYRRERGITGVPRMAVLVQLLVQADASAIAFSADPVTGARDVVVINAASGLGDAMASGEITPDSYTVRKSDETIVARSAVDGALADRDVTAIARLTAQLETVMGGAVDVECALRDGALHLLQCRPITTLAEDFPVTWKDPADAELVWRRDDAHHTGVLPPLGIEYTRNGAGYGVRRRDEELGPPQLMRFEAFNGRMYSSTKALRPPDEMARYQRDAVTRRRRLARHIRRDWDERYRPELDGIYAAMDTLPAEDASADEAARGWDELWRLHRRAWTIHMLVTAGSYPVMDELRQVYEELTGGAAADAFALTQGLAPTLQKLERDLHELTEIARRSPAGDPVARGAPIAEVRAADERFSRALDAFLEGHGDAGQSAEGIGAPSWSDEPALLLGTIAARLAQSVEHPEARLARLRRRADEIARGARERLAGRPADLARFEEVLAVATSAGPLTEEHNYWLDRRNQAHMRRAVNRFGARLVREQSLAAGDEIYLLYVSEVRAALREPRDLSSLIRERADEQRRWKRMRSPETLGATPPPAQLGSGTTMVALSHLLFKQRQDDPARLLRGVGASAGIARGPARLIRDLGEFAKLRPGDVLVCQSSNVSWIPLFTRAAAVVTEVGGALSHAAVVAREFGVPAVVGTAVALTTLADGETLEVDGASGTVTRLDVRDAFPITWADPEDAKLYWRREDTHFHQVFGPLASDYIVHGPNYGILKTDAAVNYPLHIRHLAINGHVYVNVRPLRPPEAMSGELAAAFEHQRTRARRIRAEWDGEFLPELKAHYRWMDRQDVAAMARDGAVAAWADLWRRVHRAWEIHFIVVDPVYTAMEELAQTYEKLIGGNGIAALAMTQGLAPTLQDVERGLRDLTLLARGTPELARAIDDGEREIATLRALPGGTAFGEALDRFLDAHGDVGQEGFDLEEPAWRDDPRRLVACIRQRLARADAGEARQAGALDAADDLARDARARLAGRQADLDHFDEVLAAARAAGPLSEEHNYWIDRVATAHAARLVRKFGARLVAEGTLRHGDEIFYLYVAEIESVLREPRDLSGLIAERRADLERWRAMRSPKTIGVPPEGPQPATPGVSPERVSLGYAVTQDDTSVLKGVAASPGIARGRARLVREGDFEKVQPGDVLVCRASTVSWLPLFTIASAVVTEVGGALSHAAVVAREFGVPCVVATGVAMSTLTEGEMLEVDGSAGLVRRLET